jgi:hypothetical protein
MLEWKENLDALVEETMAFAESVRAERAMKLQRIVEPKRLPSVDCRGSERDDIAHRIASFKAHQERFARDRKDYAASELKRMLTGRC